MSLTCLASMARHRMAIDPALPMDLGESRLPIPVRPRPPRPPRLRPVRRWFRAGALWGFARSAVAFDDDVGAPLP